MKNIFTILIILCSPFVLLATHNRAGEITYKHISGYKYEITITTFTWSKSLADRENLDVSWGDGETSIANRREKILLPDEYYRNIYKATHTYPGAGIYEIIVEDPNRNYGVGNIPNSVNVVFAIKTTLSIGSSFANNNSPQLLNFPIDKAAMHQVFKHNPAAWDPDGDSLSFKLATCLESGGVEIPDYSLPPFDKAFYVDADTGTLVWDAPTMKGIYNVAMEIEEWKKLDGSSQSIKISSIIRDMQIEVVESDNIPPRIQPIKNICVEAGDTVNVFVYASDANGDKITLEATGGPFMMEDNPAIFYYPPISSADFTTGKMTWVTNCSHVRKHPYLVTFRAIDNHYDVNLVDLTTIQIKVIAPAPKNLTLEPSNKTIELSWDISECPEAIGYDIYRKINAYGFNPDSCETGVPAYTGYKKIARVDSVYITSYIDNNGGDSLRQGIEYCYMVDAVFKDGAESYASEEACTYLVRGIPMITNVSVETTDSLNGKMYVAWSKPRELDSLGFPGPFMYKVFRSEGIWGKNLVFIDSLYVNELNDTIFYDSMLNTSDFAYSYKIELWHTAPGNRFRIGSPQIASSVYLEIDAADNQLELSFENNVPWINDFYTIHRLNESTQLYDSIGFSDSTGFIDYDLKNGTTYCYKIESEGGYQVDQVIYPIINYSQFACAEPIDTIPPCQPDLMVDSNCDEFFNYLDWTNPGDTCPDEIFGYNIYYTPLYDGEMELLDSINDPFVTHYTHNLIDSTLTMAGCYAVSAIDSFNNESPILNRFCVDNCTYYELPNVFTPNNDLMNDLYKPIPTYRYVEKVDMKIFNRWGTLVFQTEDPDINWDGTIMDSNKKVSDGVYYYICDVYIYRLFGLDHTTLVGFIHVFSGDEKSIKE